MTEDKKRLFLLPLFSLFIFAILLSSVSAAVTQLHADNITIVTPVASGTLSGANAIWNVTVVTGYEAQNYSLAAVYIYSAGATANTTQFLITQEYNSTVSNLNFNGTALDSRKVEDGNDYILVFQLQNGTVGKQANKTITGITINNTIPSAPRTLLPTAKQTSNTVNFSAVVDDKNTTACTLNFPSTNPGKSSYAMTYSLGSCSTQLTVSNVRMDFYVTASDGSDLVSSASQTLDMDVSDDTTGSMTPQQAAVAEQQRQQTLSIASGGTGIGTGVIIIAVLVIAIAATLFFVLKKK